MEMLPKQEKFRINKLDSNAFAAYDKLTKNQFLFVPIRSNCNFWVLAFHFFTFT